MAEKSVLAGKVRAYYANTALTSLDAHDQNVLALCDSADAQLELLERAKNEAVAAKARIQAEIKGLETAIHILADHLQRG